MHGLTNSTDHEKVQAHAATSLLQRSSRAVFLVLFLGAFSNALLAPFMGYFFVEKKGLAPWWLSVYSSITIIVSILVNRYVGRKIDHGTCLYKWLQMGQAAYATAIILLIFVPHPPILVSLVGLFLGIANTTTTTMYSFGRIIFGGVQDRAKTNSQLRVTTSLAWMLAPPLTFYLAYWNTSIEVFLVAGGIVIGWYLIGHLTLPKMFRSFPTDATASSTFIDWSSSFGIVRRTAVCFLFALAHVLCSTSIPLYYTRELALPPYAAGLSFGIKCAFEVTAILLSSLLLKRVGAKFGLFISALFGFAAFAQFLHASSLTDALLGACLEGVFYGTFAAVAMTYIQEIFPTSVGRATAVYMNSLFVGSMVGVWMLGSIATMYDFGAVIFSAVIVMAIGVAILLADTFLDSARQFNR